MPAPVLWAVVASTCRARILRGLEMPPAAASPQREIVLRAPSLAIRHLMAGAPARLRGAIRPEGAIDLVRGDLEEFAVQIAALLEGHRRAGDFGCLVVLGPRPLLGALADALGCGRAAAIFLEDDGLLVDAGAEGLRQHVRSRIAQAIGGLA